jgi:hypothetical protein
MKIGESVIVKGKKLHEATFFGMSKSGKRAGVKHNCAAPLGVHMVVDYFKPENVEKK